MIRVNILEGSQTVTHGSSTDVYGFPDLIITLLACYGLLSIPLQSPGNRVVDSGWDCSLIYLSLV